MTTSFSPFARHLENQDLVLKRVATQVLQVNTGFLCNQACRHCHLDAGPARKEVMTKKTMEQILSFQEKCKIPTVDITGGAPEMNPDIVFLVKNLARTAKASMFRSNLSALLEFENPELLDTLAENKVTIVSSFPSLNLDQTDAQRGKGTFDKSIDALKLLNDRGYGIEESGLELNLVANPSGAFLPASQNATEKRYRDVLKRKFNIVFNQAFTFANVPLGRYKTWLKKTGNYDSYIQKLADRFNPCTLEGLMCTNMISVSWDGYLFDCDFNQAAGIYKSGTKQHISEVDTCDFENDPVAVSDHCYACTAGSGFT